MRRINRTISSFFLAAALLAPLFATGCAIHARDRDDRRHEEEEEEREHRDYHNEYRDLYRFYLSTERDHSTPRVTYPSGPMGPQ